MIEVIRVQNVSKHFDNTIALRDVSFSVYEKEIFSIIGPNGAGKSTLLEILETLTPKTSGEVFINGANLDKEASLIKSSIGVQLQTSGFYPHLNLAELLNLFCGLYQVPTKPIHLLEKVGLADKIHAKYKVLSGGQKQRFSLAVALINQPSILFLDEPTTGLDPQARRKVWELIKELRESGMTLVLTTHYMEEAEILSDRVAILSEGRILALDYPKVLINNLLRSGFQKEAKLEEATLEDVLMHLTQKTLLP